MFCHNCGNKLEENSNYCQNCGAKVVKAETQITNEQLPEKENEEQKKISGFSIAGFVLSLVGLGFCGLVCGILGIIFSSIALGDVNKKQLKGKSFAVSGLILSIIGVVYNIIMLILIYCVGLDYLYVLLNY